MSAKSVQMVLYPDTHLDQAAETIHRLRQHGIDDRDISVISGVPYSDKILGRPMSWTRIGLIGLAGAVVGFAIATFLNFGTPYLYPIRVGGQPFFPIPTSIVVTFELTMLGLLISTFLGVFIETITPSYGPKGYSPKVSDGHIGVLFSCPTEKMDEVKKGLEDLKPEWVKNPEAKL